MMEMSKRVFAVAIVIALASASYGGAKRVSDYLTMPDGTRVAYDLFLPAEAAGARVPALFKYTPYGRAWTVFDKNGKNNLAGLMDIPWYGDLALRVRSLLVGNVKDALSRTEWLGDMVKSGYAVVVADRPGTGASFGTLRQSPDVIGAEASAIIDWIAAQSWSDGTVGMFGDSIQAQIQFQAAATGNRHLKAILPATTWMDNYSAVIFPGGVPNAAFLAMYARLNTGFDALATPVDSDTNGALLAQARAEREAAASLASAAQGAGSAPFRDVRLPDGRNLWIDVETLYPLLARINRSGIPVYLIDGWYDIYARDDFLIYRNLTVPKRLLVRPTDHNGIEAPGKDIDYGAEARRWFDYWLKGIDNGVMKEPPITYNLQGTGKPDTELTAQSWPPEDTRNVAYDLGSTLMADRTDSCTVDYTTTTGTKPHWTALATPYAYPDMASHDARSLSFTTAPLAAPVRVVGHPIVRLWLATTAKDLDVFAYLEAVDAKGRSTYVTQGVLRASHRKVSPAPFDTFGLPWRNHFQSELEPIPADTPMELVFDLLPTAYQFASGQRIRISIACADSGNFDTPVISPAPTLRVLHDAGHPSRVDLPVRAAQ
jgi:uncharacterized protein